MKDIDAAKRNAEMIIDYALIRDNQWLLDKMLVIQKSLQANDSMPTDFDKWLEKAEKECVVDQDLQMIVWEDFFKPRGIFPKHAKSNDR
jgi:uncharacterized NAD(P)/FAD-binding protein YdhS